MTAPAAAGGKPSRYHLATTGNRKVHFEFEIGHLGGLPSCNSGGPVVERLADLDEDGGQAETLAALLTAGIAPSRLCGHCFQRRMRAIYAKQWQDRKAKK